MAIDRTEYLKRTMHVVATLLEPLDTLEKANILISAMRLPQKETTQILEVLGCKPITLVGGKDEKKYGGEELCA